MNGTGQQENKCRKAAHRIITEAKIEVKRDKRQPRTVNSGKGSVVPETVQLLLLL